MHRWDHFSLYLTPFLLCCVAVYIIVWRLGCKWGSVNVDVSVVLASMSYSITSLLYEVILFADFLERGIIFLNAPRGIKKNYTTLKKIREKNHYL